MIQRIHVNQHVIKANKKSGARDPVLTIKTYKENRKANSIAIVDPAGYEIAKVIYSPDKPLDCGATVWIETEYEIVEL